MKPFRALFASEFKLAIRDMKIPMFGIIQPLIVVVIIGLVGNRPAFEGAGYTFLEQSFGALASIAVCATGLMGLPLALADYRHKKILRQFMVTPVSPALMLIVQYLISMVMSLISLASVWLVCRLFWGYAMIGSRLAFGLFYLLTMYAMFSIGMMIASVAADIKAASLWCVIVYFPMFFFSGATIPYEIMPTLAQKLMNVLPLAHGIKLLKAASLGLPAEGAAFSVLLLLGIGMICNVLSARFFKWT